MTSLTNPMTGEEYEKIRSSSYEIYNEFKHRVSEGRSIKLDELEKIAGGRVWLGEEGVKNGLVDNIGGLNDTIEALASKLKLDDYQVIEISEKKTIYETILVYKGVYTKVEKFLNSPIKESTKFEIKTPLLLMPYDFN